MIRRRHRTCPWAGMDRASENPDRGLPRSAAGWFTLSVGTWGLTCSAHSRIYDAAWSNPYWYHFPSLIVNAAGDLLVGFSGSRATEYIGAFFQARKANGTWITQVGVNP